MQLIHDSTTDYRTKTLATANGLSATAASGGFLKLADYQSRPTVNIAGLSLTGSVLAACLSNQGFTVIGSDPAQDKVDAINSGVTPLTETGLVELIFSGKENRKLRATTNLFESVSKSNITFICSDSGRTAEWLPETCRIAAAAIKEAKDFHLVVISSSVPVGATSSSLIPLLEEGSGKVAGKDFGVCYVPFFLRSGRAIEDFLHPAITVIGATDHRSAQYAERILDGLGGEVITTSLETAEMLKSVMGSWQAVKAGFGNEIARLCKSVNIDSHDVMNILIKDSQQSVSATNLKPGFSFGGAQSAADALCLKNLAFENNVDVPLIAGLEKTNSAHLRHLLRLIEDQETKKVGFIGVSPSEGSDDYLDSLTLRLIRELTHRGIQASFYDPAITEKTKLGNDLKEHFFMQSRRCLTEEEMLTTSECLVVTHYKDYAYQILNRAGSHISVIDAVRVLGDTATRASYQGIGW